MHFEVLVEDQSGSIALEAIMEKILGTNYTSHSWRLHPYKGLGRLPKNLRSVTDPKKRILLDQLPAILQGYGKSLTPHDVVIVVIDLDDRDCLSFKKELVNALDACNPRPRALFRIAIEESEAWLLGDRNAVKSAYPLANNFILNSYQQDSICGTWEVLADAVYQGGAARLKQLGYPDTGIAKCEWAREITPYIDVNSNQSKSFQVFRDAVRSLAGV